MCCDRGSSSPRGSRNFSARVYILALERRLKSLIALTWRRLVNSRPALALLRPLATSLPYSGKEDLRHCQSFLYKLKMRCLASSLQVTQER